MAYTHIDPGKEIEVSCHAYYSAGGLDISDLITLSIDELDKREQASIEQEKAIFEKMQDIEPEWEQQARQTVLLRQARQYLKTPPTKHTSNQWVKLQHDYNELSNMVYKMSWRVYENTRYDKTIGQSVPVSWELSWYLSFNTPENPDSTRSGRQFAGQDRKRFTDKAVMEKYLQGRIAAYAHLFTEISPPIPKGQESRFSVNGCLLPGYTVEVPERTPQEVANELLDFLDDVDMKTSQSTVPTDAEKRPAKKKAPDKTNRSRMTR